ncbi:MAG TPA: phospholipase D-like domain-containing protein [Solimonas sp.]|nr:phospholipase D-like domain-containing protein [Solimonas sp.]
MLKLLTCVFLTSLAACAANLPAADAASGPAPTTTEQGAPLPRLSEPALRAAVGDDPAALAFARRVADTETRLTREPLTEGNRVQLLVDGPAAHAAQLEAIGRARDHVHLLTYIITDDELGQKYAALLIAKARQGVKVRLAYDSVGGMGAAPQYFEELRAAGVETLEFNSVNPLKEPRLWRINHRGHRKLLIVDGAVGFTGGINIADDYARPSPAAGSSSSRGWRDTHIRVDGPGVAGFQKAFLQTWENQKGALPDRERYFPARPHAGHDLVRLVTNDGQSFLGAVAGPGEAKLELKPADQADKSHDIYASYLAALHEARSRVWITQAYFAPDEQFLEALKGAVQRGADVRLLMPGTSDVGLVLHASRHYYDDLLRSGMKLYEYQDVMLHAKTAVIDGVWSTVGSSNLDFRSFLHNDEANAAIIGRDFGAQMEQQFREDLGHAQAITLEQWRKRGVVQRTREFFANMVKYWL